MDKPAPTAEELLPPLDVTPDDRLNAETRQYSMGCDFETIAERDAVEAMVCRERQLRAALRSNREKDAQLAEKDKIIEEMSEASERNEIQRDAALDESERLLAEKDAKIAELERSRDTFNAIAESRTGQAMKANGRAEAAEAKLRAVSEAAK